MSGEGIKIYGFFLVGEMIGKRSIIGYQVLLDDKRFRVQTRPKMVEAIRQLE
jgi:hypothetical protein